MNNWEKLTLKIDQSDFLKGVAIIFVLLGHIWGVAVILVSIVMAVVTEKCWKLFVEGVQTLAKMGLNEVADKVMTNFQGLYDIYFFLIVLSKGMGFESDNIWYKVSFAIGTVLICLKLYNETYKKEN